MRNATTVPVTVCESCVLPANKPPCNNTTQTPSSYLVNAGPPLLLLGGSVQPPERRKPAPPLAGRPGHGLCPSPHARLPRASRHLPMPRGFSTRAAAPQHKPPNWGVWGEKEANPMGTQGSHCWDSGDAARLLPSPCKLTHFCQHPIANIEMDSTHHLGNFWYLM